MKRYILKKDLPTFNKGETFIFDGDLWRESDNVLAYTKLEFDEFPNILKDWFEEIPEYKRWRADIGEYYWYLDSDGTPCTTTDREYDMNDRHFSIGNYLKTEEEAKKARDWLKAFTVLRDDTEGFKPDWNNGTEKKYFVTHDHSTEELWVGSDSKYQNKLIYFKSREDVEASIAKHEKEWLTFFGVEDEKNKKER